jgi:hypothetical protein
MREGFGSRTKIENADMVRIGLIDPIEPNLRTQMMHVHAYDGFREELRTNDDYTG